MNKAELVAALAEKNKMTKKEAEAVLDALTATITETLSKGEKVQIVGFGLFENRERAPKLARNPRTGEPVKVPATIVPTFKPGKLLKEAVK